MNWLLLNHPITLLLILACHFLGKVIIQTAHLSSSEQKDHAKSLLGGPKTPVTPLKINMEPKNGGLEDHFPF